MIVAQTWATRRLFCLGGATLLLVSDVMIGGGLMVVQWFRREPKNRTRVSWTVFLLLSLLAIGSGLVLHGLHVVPFAPWVPTAQKGVILSFVLWLLFLSTRPVSVIVSRRLCIFGNLRGQDPENCL